MTQDADRKGATAYPRAVLDLFDAYVHGAIDRRGFVTQCAVHVGSAAAATTMLAALSPDFARGQVIKPDDKRIIISHVDIASPAGNGTVRAYVARPAAKGLVALLSAVGVKTPRSPSVCATKTRLVVCLGGRKSV